MDWLATAVSFTHEHDGWKHPVYANGKGRGVLLLHELTGMSRPFVELATTIMESGFRVYAPLFFGEPGKNYGPFGLLGVNQMRRYCVTREFNVLATNGRSEIAEWLRTLCRRVHEECGGNGVAAMGLCFTGSIILSVMLEPRVVAPVMSEPAIPLTQWLPFAPAPPLEDRKRALGVPDDDVKAAAIRAREAMVRVYRFKADKLCPDQRIAALKGVFGDAGVTVEEFDSGRGTGSRAKAHAVFTRDLSKDPSHPTRVALTKLIEHFRITL